MSQYVGIREANNDIRLVSFMDFDLGFFDKDEDQVEPVSNSLFSQERSHVSGMDFFRRTGATGVENPSQKTRSNMIGETK